MQHTDLDRVRALRLRGQRQRANQSAMLSVSTCSSFHGSLLRSKRERSLHLDLEADSGAHSVGLYRLKLVFLKKVITRALNSLMR